MHNLYHSQNLGNITHLVVINELTILIIVKITNFLKENVFSLNKELISLNLLIVIFFSIFFF
jgi:hypothetical protein